MGRLREIRRHGAMWLQCPKLNMREKSLRAPAEIENDYLALLLARQQFAIEGPPKELHGCVSWEALVGARRRYVVETNTVFTGKFADRKRGTFFSGLPPRWGPGGEDGYGGRVGRRRPAPGDQGTAGTAARRVLARVRNLGVPQSAPAVSGSRRCAR